MLVKSCQNNQMSDLSKSTDSKAEEPRKRKPRFWVGPLLVGCSFSLGYGITHRLVTLQTNPEPQSQPETFAGLHFPGESLASLRQANGTKSPLAVDIAAIEAKEALARQARVEAEEQVRRNAESARKNEVALQAPLSESNGTTSDISAPQLLWPQGPQPVPAVLIDPLVDPSLLRFNPRDPLLEATASELTDDQSDFLVPVAPIPAIAP